MLGIVQTYNGETFLLKRAFQEAGVALPDAATLSNDYSHSHGPQPSTPPATTSAFFFHLPAFCA